MINAALHEFALNVHFIGNNFIHKISNSVLMIDSVRILGSVLHNAISHVAHCSLEKNGDLNARASIIETPRASNRKVAGT